MMTRGNMVELQSTTTPARLLVVDDDPSVLSGLRRALQLAGYEVQGAEDGETALALAEAQEFDLVILDVMLPGFDGLTVCGRLRAKDATPILLLTAKDTVPDRVAGLDAGADDYLVKPFASAELLARVRALLRRVQARGGSVLKYADVALDAATREIFRAGTPIKLTPTEFELLTTFLRHPRQVLSRNQLCQAAWGYAFDGESNFVDVAVKDLRKKLEADGRPRLIQTLRGFGYALRED
jgi:two-component system, OmpR family, response regulator MprA